MDNIEIFPMTVSDLNVLSPTLLSDYDDFWTENILKSELENPNSKLIIAKANDLIVGFGGIWKAIDIIHITNIVVKKDLRCKGIGSIILDNLINIANNYNDTTSITLEVNKNNLSAIHLYTKFNFKEVGLRKRYYNNIDDALIMTKDLK